MMKRILSDLPKRWLWKALSILVSLSLTLAPALAPTASAADLVQEWLTMDYKGTSGYRVMVVSSSGTPLNIADRPLHISDPISSIYVLNPDGSRAAPDLEQEIIFLAQSSEQLEDDTFYYTNWQLPEDYASWVRTDNEDNDYRIFLPMATGDTYLELSVLCSTCSIGNYSRRVERYKEVFRAAIFAEMHLDAEALKQEFDETFGKEFLDVMDQAQSAIGTGGWANEVLGLMEPFVEFHYGSSSSTFQTYSTWTGAMGYVFTGLTFASWINAASMEVLLMHALAQGEAAQRLADLKTWRDTATYSPDIDPAIFDAIDSLVLDWDQITETDIEAVINQIIDDVGMETVVFSFVQLGVALANTAHLISPALAPWLSVAFLAIEGWLLVRERAEQVASIGAAGTASFDLMKEVTDNPSRWSNGDDLRYLLNLLHMSKYLAFHYYDVTLEKASGVDNWLFHPLSQDYADWLDELRSERSQRQTAFLLSGPITFLTGDGHTVWLDRVWLRDHIASSYSTTLSNPSVDPPSGHSAHTPNWTFNVDYTSSANTTPEFVKLVLSGSVYPETEFAMDAVDPGDLNYADGATFQFEHGQLDSNFYSYHFETSDGGSTTSTGPLTLHVTVPQPSEVSLTADPSSVPVDGASKSLVTATVTTTEGTPLQGAQVTFECSGVLGSFELVDTGAMWNRVETDENGEAPIYFQPRSSGTAHISARLDSGLSGAIDVEATGSNDVELRIRFIRNDDLEYDVHIEAMYLASGTPIQFEDVTLSTSRGTLTAVGDPGITGSTIILQTNSSAGGSYPGAVRARLDIPSVGETTITATLRSVSEAVSSYLGGEPATIRPFKDLPGDWSADWSPEGSTLAVGGSDYQIHIYDTATWSQLIQWQPEDGFANVVYDARYSADGSELAIASRYPTRERVSDGAKLWEGNLFSTRHVDISDNGSWLAAGSRDETRVWTIAGTLAKTIYHTDDWVRSLVFSPNSQYLLIGHDSGQVRIYQTSTWTATMDFDSDPDPDDNDEVWAADWAPDSTKFIISTAEQGLLLYNLGSTSPYASYTQHGIPSGVDALAWCPISDIGHSGYGKIASSAGTSLHIWNAQTQQPLLQAPNSGANRALAWSPDCEFLVFPAGVVAPWDTVGPYINVSSHFHEQAVNNAHIDVEGTILDEFMIDVATLTVNGGGAIPLTLDGSGGFTQGVDLLPGDNLLSIYAEDGTGNPSTHQLTITLLTDTSPPVISLAVGDDPGPHPLEICTLAALRARIADPWSGVDPSTTYAAFQYPDGVNIGSVPLYDDGIQGGDTDAGDGVYSGQWDSCLMPEEGYAYIDIEAADNNANPAQADNFMVLDVYDLPTITQVDHDPLQPTDRDTVLVSVVGDDPSGISQGRVSYSIDGGLSYIEGPMTYNDGVGAFEGSIPPQDMGEVLYRVSLRDTKGHEITADGYSYSVVDASPPLFSGWDQNTPDLKADWSGGLQVLVDVADVGGSGLDGMTPQLRYMRGGYDVDFTSYADMTQISPGGDSSIGASSTGGTWAFDIPIPAGGWASIEGETIIWQVQLDDASGNTGISQARTDVVDDDDAVGPPATLPSDIFSVEVEETLILYATISDAATGGHGVTSAALYYGFDFPYDTYPVAGTGPGGNGDGEWMFTIPAQTSENQGEILKFYILATDGDDTPADAISNNYGEFFDIVILGENKIYLPIIMN